MPLRITLGALALAGCVESTGSGGGQMPATPMGPPFITTFEHAAR